MIIDRCVNAALLLIVLTFMSAAAPGLAEKQPGAAAQAPDCWLKTPTVSVMTGFIYEPLEPYTIQEWMENLGNRFDADQWVKDFKECGATHLVFYDKWIDGLVFHDTKTTNFKTKRDFVRELAAACRRGGLPLVLYFNALSDGNPEFDKWATLDKQGKPIVFGARWPTLIVTAEDARRYRVIATRIYGAHVIHVIDSQTDLPGSPPRKVPISLLSARLGDFQNATPVGGNKLLELSAEGPMISLTVEPDPVASVILR